MSDEKLRRIEQLNADLKAFHFKIEDDLYAVGVDYGYGPSRSVVTTTCARCSATIDPAAVEQHHERCFRVGDWLRLDCSHGGGSWVEGPIVTLRGSDGHAAIFPKRGSSDMRHRLGGDPFTFNLKYLDGVRHIQRPGQIGWQFRCQGDRDGQQCERYAGPPAGMGWRCPDHELQDAMEAMEQFTPILPPEVDPLDVIYDELSLRQLIEMEENDRREAACGWMMAGGWKRCATPDQRAAVSAHWSAQLRARISAAKERERIQVRIEQDVED